MAANQGKVSIVERSMRSILVGNIPHEASEEKLKELLTEFGPLLNIKFFKNNLSIYAFCEYGEQEMALRAMRKLSNYELKGRILKVDMASSEKSKEELQNLQEVNSSQTEAASVTDGSSEKAPEEISKAVASLPAEQMFELMKQMKMCIENNPQEARNLLLQNPQLAFALLQAQVIMRIVDPEVAMQVLNRPTTPEQDVKTAEPTQQGVLTTSNLPEVASGDQDFRQHPPMDQDMRPSLSSGDKDLRLLSGDSDMRTMNTAATLMDKRVDPRFRSGDPRVAQSADPRASSRQGTDPRLASSADPRVIPADPRMSNNDPRMMAGTDPRMMQGTDPRMMQGTDPRMMQGTDPRMMPGADSRSMPGSDPRMMVGIDPRAMPSSDPRALSGGDPRAASVDPRMVTGPEARAMSGIDPRVMSGSDPRMMTGADPRMMPGLDPRMIPGSDPRIMPSSDPRALPNVDPRGLSGPDPRMMPGSEMGNRLPPGSNFGPRPAGNVDPRRVPTTAATARMPSNTRTTATTSPANVPGMPPTAVSAPRQPLPVSAGPSPSIPEDEEKAALIMQVLQLSEEQIAQLPPEQRQSIIVLKEQIARSQLSL